MINYACHSRCARYVLSAVAGLFAMALACTNPPANDNTGDNTGNDGASGSGLPVLPGATTITNLEVTGATVGGTGLIRVTLGDPVSADTIINLTSDNPPVAAVPASGTILAGSAQLEISFSGVAAGQADITAQLASSSRSATATVVSAIQVSFVFTSNGPLQTGAHTQLSVELNAVAPADLTVNLTSSNPAALTVPSTIIVPSFANEQTVAVTAGAPGSAIITATLGASSQTTFINVVATPSLDQISLSPSFKVVAGSPLTLFLDLDADVATDTTVALTSSNTTALTVPATVKVLADTSFLEIPLTAGSAGQATVTASLNGSQSTTSIRVVTAPSLTSFSAPSQINQGTAGEFEVFLDTDAAVDTTITITSSNPGLVTIPATITVPAGNDRASGTFNAVNTGQVLLTATLGSSFATATVLVIQPSTTPPTLSSAFGPNTLTVGSFSSIGANLTVPAVADTTVTFTNSNPAVLSVPASAVILAGNNSVNNVPIQALAVGNANITATALGSSFTFQVQVLPGGLQVSFLNASNPHVGFSTTLFVGLNQTVTADTTVTLTNTAPAVLAVPGSVVIPSGSSGTSVPIAGLAASPPNAVITATLGASTKTVTITVLP